MLDGVEPDVGALSKEMLDYKKTVDVIMGKTLYSDSWLEV
jgi:5-methyltetrahydrofolate corrinoid/iron sulfur protein methyltransferase